jgi:hypothetical protein
MLPSRLIQRRRFITDEPTRSTGRHPPELSDLPGDLAQDFTCGRVIQSSGPLRYGVVEGLDVSDSRVHDHPPHWNAAVAKSTCLLGVNDGSEAPRSHGTK